MDSDPTPLTPGMQVGPYEIKAVVGVGGMGEVYRARDVRLNRDVAIKALRGTFAPSAEGLRRFAREARAAGALNHPNVVAIYDIGTHNGAPYIVTELLAGQTLEQRLRAGRLPIRTAIEYAAQIAAGLAAAHEKGVIHRDLKPSNIFLTDAGGVKILDFGLAKLLTGEETAPHKGTTATITPETPPGRILGTPAYMSPEQVRGEELDPRSDIFSFGVVFYEMLTGRQAFDGSSQIEIMNRILREDPSPFETEIIQAASPAVALILRRCLAKRREERFESARDVSYSVSAIGDSLLSVPREAGVRSGSRRNFLLASAAAAPALAAGVLIGRGTADRTVARFQRCTFRRGSVYSARFSSDGRTIVYAAAWEDGKLQIYSVRPESPESSVIGFPGANLLAVSPTGVLALALKYRYVSGFVYSGMLATAPMGGGSPREIAADVECADWAPDGSGMAIVRHVAGKTRLEHPIGQVIYETGGWLSNVRFSPDGTRIGFLEHPTDGDNAGFAAFVDLSGKKTVVSRLFEACEGASWSSDGKELWFTGARSGANLILYASRGNERELVRIPGWNVLADTANDRRALLSSGTLRFELFAFGPSQKEDQRLSWYDWSLARDISNDGTLVLFDETGEGGGKKPGVYIRKTEAGDPIRLGDGSAMSLSPDAKWALTLPAGGSPEIVLLPVGPGEPKRLPLPNGISAAGAQWYPDGKRILLAASQKGHGVRLYEMQLGVDLSATAPRPFTPEGLTRAWHAISPDGRFVMAAQIDGRTNVFETADGAIHSGLGIEQGELPIRWSADGRHVYIQSRREVPASVYRVEVATGRRELWKQIAPPDPAGVRAITTVQISPNGKWYAYSIESIIDDIYVVDGLS